jgi:hypothetical protein
MYVASRCFIGNDTIVPHARHFKKVCRAKSAGYMVRPGIRVGFVFFTIEKKHRFAELADTCRKIRMIRLANFKKCGIYYSA